MRYPKEVRHLLTKYHLKVLKPFRIADGGFVRSYVLLCKNDRGMERVLKVFASKDENAKRKFLREVSLLIRIGVDKKLSNFVIKVYKYNLDAEKGTLFYLMEYVKYESFGEFIKDLGYKKGVFKKDTFDIFLSFWENLNGLFEDDDNLSAYGLSRFYDELDYYQKQNSALLKPSVWESVKKYLNARENLLNTPSYLSHLDLYPENLFVKKAFSGRFKVIDWEQAHKTSFGCNEAFLYLLFWREEYFRKKVFSYAYNAGDRDAYFTSFTSFVLLLSIRFLYQIEAFVDKKHSEYKSFRSFLLYTINDVVSGSFGKPKNLQFLVSNDIISNLLKEFYGLGGEIKVEDFSPGYSNTMIRITPMTNSDNPLVFRLYSIRKSKDAVMNEARAYEYLSKRGFPTYKIYRNNFKSLISTKELYGRRRYFILTSYLDGKTMSRSKMTVPKVAAAGLMLKRMHDLGVVHGDFNRRNLLYAGGRISGVIDMEFAKFTKKKRDFMKDLGRALSLWMQGVDKEASLDVKAVYAAFLSGYFGKKDWERKKEDLDVGRYLMEELFKLEKDYRKMNRNAPSDYFKGIIRHIKYLQSIEF